MTQAERLNNAIIRLDWVNGGNAEIADLAKDWIEWWNGARAWVPEGTAAWWSVLQYYWFRYRAAYARAASTQGVPRPEEVDPTLIATVREDAARRVDAIRDAGRTADKWIDQKVQDFATHARPTMLPIGIALGAAAMLGFVLLTRKAG